MIYKLTPQIKVSLETALYKKYNIDGIEYNAIGVLKIPYIKAHDQLIDMYAGQVMFEKMQDPVKVRFLVFTSVAIAHISIGYELLGDVNLTKSPEDISEALKILIEKAPRKIDNLEILLGREKGNHQIILALQGIKSDFKNLQLDGPAR